MAHTFWDSKEAEKHDTIAMFLPDAVVYITNR